MILVWSEYDLYQHHNPKLIYIIFLLLGLFVLKTLHHTSWLGNVDYICFKTKDTWQLFKNRFISLFMEQQKMIMECYEIF